MTDRLMALIDRYAHLIYKSRTEPASKYELREYDAIRCRMDIEKDLSEDRSQAYEECARSRVLMNEAAPDMLEALKAFEAHYPMGVNPFLDDAFRSARAAISKAKGINPDE